MGSIAELEKHVMQKPKKAAPEDLDILARHHWDQATGTVCLDVPPGRYKACVLGFATARSESVIAVVAATSDEARNETTTVDNLLG